MAKRLFSCPQSETAELDYFSNIMEENNIDYYIVPGSAFGLSKPSLWIRDNDDFTRAKQLFEKHQPIYAQHAREKYQKETGYDPDADSKTQFKFFLNNLYRKRALLPWIFLGFVILYWYFSSFFGIFVAK